MTIGKDDLVGKLLRTGVEIQRMQSPTMKQLGNAAKERMLRAAVQAAGPDRKFSNLGKAKGFLDVAVKVVADGDAEAEAVITARGPWGISESAFGPYEIMARLSKIQRKGMKRDAYQAARRKRDLDIAFRGRGLFSGATPLGNRRTAFGPRYRVSHPGSKGRNNWSQGQAEVYPFAIKYLESQTLRTVAKVWT